MRNRTTKYCNLAVACALAASVLATAGCGNNGLPGMIPMRGQVTLDGEPLSKGEVRWVPQAGAGRMARGRLDEKGKFSLTTATRDDGVATGEYKIVVIAYGPEVEPKRDAAGYVIEAPPRPLLVPKQYASPETTPLSESVDGGHRGYIELELQS